MHRTDRRVRVGLTVSFAFGFLVCVLLPAVGRAGSAWQVSAGLDHSCALTAAGAVKCWGSNVYGQLGNGTTTSSSTPAAVSGLSGGVAAVGAGRNYSCALTVDGGVKCWGDNQYGQLGDGTTTDRLTPMDVTDLTSGIAALSVGRNHVCALSLIGTVKCWGQNVHGAVGDGTFDSPKATPVSVTGLTGVAAIAAGGYHTCVVTTAGAAKCWGMDSYGELGDDATTNKSTPVAVSGLTSGVAAISLGLYSTCALTTDAAVLCWGYNGYGQLGDGSTTDRHTPTSASGLASGVAAIGAGYDHACAVLASGALRCWGDNAQSQVGDGTVTNRTTPVAVIGQASGVAAVSSGDGHTCALRDDGGVKCWGDNAYGQLGDDSTTDRITPIYVRGLTGGDPVPTPGAAQVAPGASHACLLTNGGGVECWGYNVYGQLGDGTTTDRASPVPVHGLASGVVAVSTGYGSSCALTAAGGVKCWGHNVYGELGDGTTTNSPTPVDVSGLTSGIAGLEVGRYHACAVTTGGALRCWGYNDGGQIGDGTLTNRATPIDVPGLGTGVAAVSAGGHHTCALTSAGGVKCWGDNAEGQLGNGTTTDSLTPVWVNGLSSGAANVSAGNYFTCALTTGGAVKCWGSNSYGQVGDGTTTARSTPVSATGLGGGVSAISAGYYHACARSSDGRVQCWGSNNNGELGDGSIVQRTTPVAVAGLASGAASIAGGLYFTCAVTARGGVQCWGYNSVSRLGDRTTTDRPTPGWVAGHVAGTDTIAAGHYFSCRLTATGGVQCWGRNDYGELGDGTTVDHAVPVDVTGLTGVVAIATGQRFACALTSSGGVKCWGNNFVGQLGDGTTTNSPTPVDVSGRTSGTVAITAGLGWACAVTASGGIQCWGSNNIGQLGDGTLTDRHTPVWALGLTSGMSDVKGGNMHTCALTQGGGVKCWGSDAIGELGDATSASRSYAAFVSGLSSGVSEIATDGSAASTCALTTAGNVVCWGRNAYGELGDGTTTTRNTPVSVSGLGSGVAQVSLGSDHTCAVVPGGSLKCWGRNQYGQLGDGTAITRSTPTSVTGLTSGVGAIVMGWYQSFALTAAGSLRSWGINDCGLLGDGTTVARNKAVAVRGFKLHDDYDADSKADVAVYRPSTGTWFSMDSSSGNASYQYRGWGVQAQGDVSVPSCDFDGDGVVDPTVFRPSAGTWFILKSGTNYTAWDYFGWGSTGDTPVPADYDGDGMTDGAVFRASTGAWYVRPSSGATQWNVTFGNSTDVPIPGSFDADGKADIAVYRPSTGTWFVLTSASDYTDYWYRGWGVNAQGDTPAPGDYDGDGKLDLCVFRPTTGTWFILESHATFTSWNYYGWGASGDTIVPSDYDGDGITDVAVYRPSTYTWYIRPSSGAAQWSVAFGAAGDQPLVTIR